MRVAHIHDAGRVSWLGGGVPLGACVCMHLHARTCTNVGMYTSKIFGDLEGASLSFVRTMTLLRQTATRKKHSQDAPCRNRRRGR